MKTQTATEFLIEEMQKRIPPFYAHYVMDMNSLYDQAKAMEKEQIQDAFYHGIDVDSWNVENPYVEAKQYYQKNYGI